MILFIRRSFLSLLFLLCIVDSRAQDSSLENPFREILTLEELGTRLELRSEEVAESIYLATETKHPAVGMKIVRVNRGQNAERSGVRKDSILFQRNEGSSWADYIPMPFIHEPYIAKLIDPDGNDYEVELEPGILGILVRREYHLEIAYLRGEIGIRNPRWDRQILVACMTHSTDPELCETALYHAVKSGYAEDALTDFFQIILRTYTKEGPEKAMEQFFLRLKDQEIPWVYFPPMHNALIVTGRIDFIQRIADQAGKNGVFDPGTVDKFLKWTDGGKKWPKGSLLERANTNRGKLLSGEFVGYRKGKIDERGRNAGTVFDFSSRPGHYFTIDFRDDDLPQNLHYHMKLSLQANGLSSRWSTALRLVFKNQFSDSDPAPEVLRFQKDVLTFPQRLLYLNFKRYPEGTRISTAGSGLPGLKKINDPRLNIPFVEDPDIPTEKQKAVDENNDTSGKDPVVLRIDFIRYRNEIGIFINDICYLHLPCDPESKRVFSINLHAVGMKGSIEEPAVWGLKD